MPRKFGNEIRLPGTTGIDNLPIPLTMTLSWQTELYRKSKRILELKCCLGSGIFTAAVKRGVVPHTHKQRVLAAISKLRSAFFTGYKNKICTYYIYIIY